MDNASNITSTILAHTKYDGKNKKARMIGRWRGGDLVSVYVREGNREGGEGEKERKRKGERER